MCPAWNAASRHRDPRRLHHAVAILAVALVLAACAPAAAPTAPGARSAAPAESAAPREPRLIRFGLPSLALSYMPMYLADEQGIFAQHGLKAEFMIMETSIAPAAMTHGEIDYAGSGTSAVDYALQGGEVRLVMRLYDASPWVMMARPDIPTPPDLRGKTIATSGSSPKLFALEGVRRLGLVPNEDVFFVETGGTSASFSALTSGQIGAAVVTPPFDAKAKSLGFRELMFLGDLLDIPYVELPTSKQNLDRRPDVVKDTIRSLFVAMRWWREHPEETTQIIADKFAVTPDEARSAYDTFTRIMTTTGDVQESGIRAYLRTVEQTAGVRTDVPFDRLVDLRLLKEVQAEMGIR